MAEHRPPVTDADLRRIYASSSTIATVGASTDTSKPASVVPRYMKLMGYRVIPVHPTADELFGETVHRSLDDVADPVDIVDVFRPEAEADDVAQAAIRIGAKVVWLQDGTVSPAAADAATGAGVTIVDGCCIATTYARLGLGPNPAEAVRASEGRA